MLNEAQREEALYDFWIMSGGREKAESAAHMAALDALSDLEARGYEVLKTWKKLYTGTDEYPVVHAVVLRDDKSYVIHWRHGRFWYSPNDCGSVWFE